MRITNNKNLPLPIFNALKKYETEYTGSNSDISVTTLIAPAKIRRLKSDNYNNIEEDVSGMLYGLMGKAIHTILEKHSKEEKDELIEKRFEMKIDSYDLSGQIDRFAYGVLQDWKLCSTWEYIYGIKPEKIAQLNIYAVLLKNSGYHVKRLENVLFFRDYSLSKAKRDLQYPQSQIEVVEIELWPYQKTIDYIKSRLREHFEEKNDCINDERWMKDEKWAVYKNANKKATKLCDSEKEAKEYIENHKDGKNMTIVYRPGEYTRCNDYCLVNKFCNQYNESVA